MGLESREACLGAFVHSRALHGGLQEGVSEILRSQRERVLPSSQDSEPMTDEQAVDFVIETTLGSLGLTNYEDIKVYLGRMPARVLWKGSRTAIEGYLDSLR